VDVRLSAKMTPEEFDRGYWYAVELKRFAASIGVPRVSALRKDELEVLIRGFLKTGRVALRRLQRRNGRHAEVSHHPTFGDARD
jgi:hypothetical protein